MMINHTQKLLLNPLEKGYANTWKFFKKNSTFINTWHSWQTAIQIDGVLHEFTSIKGYRDVTDSIKC